MALLAKKRYPIILDTLKRQRNANLAAAQWHLERTSPRLSIMLGFRSGFFAEHGENSQTYCIYFKNFLGANGISAKGGFAAPDKNEANVKSIAMKRGREVFILGDHSKFGKISAIKFAELKTAEIITDKAPDQSTLRKLR